MADMKQFEERMKAMVIEMINENNKQQEKVWIDLMNEQKILLREALKKLISAAPEFWSSPSSLVSIPAINPPSLLRTSSSSLSLMSANSPAPNQTQPQIPLCPANSEKPMEQLQTQQQPLIPPPVPPPYFNYPNQNPPQTQNTLNQRDYAAENSKEEHMVILCLQGVCENAFLRLCTELLLGECSRLILKEYELEKWRRSRYKNVQVIVHWFSYYVFPMHSTHSCLKLMAAEKFGNLSHQIDAPNSIVTSMPSLEPFTSLVLQLSDGIDIHNSNFT